jgi:DNA-binding transcriptional LysR family regulator
MTPSGERWMEVPIREVELRHLRYFVAVAEELHFGRAANRLRLAAPSLSKQIRQLETLLGYALFARGTRRVTLTPGGAAFFSQAREALTNVALAVTLGAAASAIGPAGVCVGYSPWIDPLSLLRLRDAISREIGLEISLRSECTASQVDSLLARRLNVGVVILPIESTNGLTIESLPERITFDSPPGGARFGQCGHP